ncbi:amidohydrolase family protein [Kordia algicida OT-1]|uniref:D-aminoacylase (Aspartate, glutamate etc) n=1 Tax=Kordia algicida OT-1 TaxID=391587 RepID=A9DU93_9FLAO|nr:amidohydrolase family protein [Kordia algicida]EDP96263.1 d-aminoacylase (aspartate, glutamate etc) [Kordia algicida OT-1]
MLDFYIQHAKICTGHKQTAKIGNVGIQDDRIVCIHYEGDDFIIPEAKEKIDATGLILTPGFIDPHASTGFGYFFPNAADHKLYQGITTEIFGNCGTSPAPIAKHLDKTMNRLSDEIGFPFEWRSLQEYFDQIADKLQFNIATLVGHSTLRAGNMDDWHNLQPSQLEAMKTALAEAMDEGALGISTGLIYAPGCFAEMDEIVTLAKVTAEKGGVYASHVRNERDGLEEAVEEALTIGKQANIRVLISHIKAAEKENWGKIPKVLNMLEEFNKTSELQAACDVYPYTAVSTKLRAFIPKYMLQDGIAAVSEKMKDSNNVSAIAEWITQKDYDMSRMLIISDDLEAYYNKNVSEIAEEHNISLAQAIANILQASTETWVVYHCIDQKDIDTAVLWEHSMICTDSWSYPINAPKSIGQPHPRSYGAFTEYLQRFVIDEKMLSWEEAIHKVTYLPAEFFQLEHRGLIEEGYYADVVLFDPKSVKANATYLSPRELSSGVEHLWVNGTQLIQHKKIQDTTPGKVLTLKD